MGAAELLYGDGFGGADGASGAGVSDEDDVVGAGSGGDGLTDDEGGCGGGVVDGEGGDIERLRVDVAGDGKAEELAEGRGADVRGSEEGLLALDSDARVGVLLRRYALAEGCRGQEKQQQEDEAGREEWGPKRFVGCCALRPGE